MPKLSEQHNSSVVVDVLEAAIRNLPGGDAAIAAAVAALPANDNGPI